MSPQKALVALKASKTGLLFISILTIGLYE